ncbi:MAG: hypothetical protein PHT60_02445 [Acidiphilium sp.]|nr:hypothetical protein [Acidiphilium sp.]MDD4934615.1 hypothetical protein [Acidiphilium sp.]
MLEVDAPAATEGNEIARKNKDGTCSSLNDQALERSFFDKKELKNFL